MERVIKALAGEFADLIVVDRDGQMVLVVKVSARPIGPAGCGSANGMGDFPIGLFHEVNKQVVGESARLPFLLIAAPDYLRIFRCVSSDEGSSEEVGPRLVGCIETASVVGAYRPDYGTKPIFKLYLTALVEAWLGDLTHHWKYPEPPASAALESTGLLGMLEGGTILAGEPEG